MLQIIGLAAVYFLTAKLGLTVSAVNVYAAIIWPPSGIALTALVLYGFRLWPGIMIGAFVLNLTLGASPLVALAIAVGNTLEAVVAAYLLRRFGFDRSLCRVKDVCSLLFLAAFFSTAISATIGAGVLTLSGLIPEHTFSETWIAWWSGDMLGDLLMASFLFVWSRKPIFKKLSFLEYTEAILLFSFTCICCLAIFTVHRDEQVLKRPYLLFPAFVFVAIRLNQRWTVTAIAMVAGITLWITASGVGFYEGYAMSHALLRAQTFVAVLAITQMILAAMVMERKEREREAKEALQIRDEFLSIASHELKTPLTSLFLQLQLCNRELKLAEAKSESTDMLSIPKRAVRNHFSSEQQAKRISALLDDLLDLTRIRLGKIKLEKEQIDLGALTQDVIDRFRSEQNSASPDFHIESSDSITGNWDRMRVEQVVTNLVSNAIKYGQGSPIYISLESDDSIPYARIKVRDSGMGIAPDLTERIFERFERGGVNGNHISGLGLGLYICRQIVEAHQGTIQVQSELGKGSTFSVHLPRT